MKLGVSGLSVADMLIHMSIASLKFFAPKDTKLFKNRTFLKYQQSVSFKIASSLSTKD